MGKIKTQRLRPVTAVIAISASLSLASCGFFGTLPTDSQLKATLAAHRQGFTELVAMSNQDKHVWRITHEFFKTDVSASGPQVNISFSNTRWRQYLTLFNKIGCHGGIIRWNPQGTIHFVMGSNGSVISSMSKGLVYSPVKLSPIVQSLDGDALWDNAQKMGKMTEAYVDLGEGWYIFKNAY